MTGSEYASAKETLGWTHEKLSRVLGLGKRTPYRYIDGGVIPEPVARLLRLLVTCKLTMSHRKFEALIEQLSGR